MPALYDFATWASLLKLLQADNAKTLAAPGGHVAGQICPGGWSVPFRRQKPPPERPSQVDDDAVRRVSGALKEAGKDCISFVMEITAPETAVLHVIDLGTAVEPGVASAHPGTLVLVEGAVSEPWRRLPDPTPEVAPAPSADVALLERALRERLPDAVGATEAAISAAETRLGIPLPEELKALYRVTRARWADWCDDYQTVEEVFRAVGCVNLFSLDDLYIADPPSRRTLWRFAAREAVETLPDDAVQGLVGAPGWIVFGHNGYGDRFAVDLTPGPCGHAGQIIILNHDENIGANLVADSLTDLVMNRRSEWRRPSRRADQPAVVAYVNSKSLPSIEAAAHAGLEVLDIGVRDSTPLSLAPVFGLPRLRTLSAYPGTLANPLEIAKLTNLEYLELGPDEWCILLDADAVPRSLLAAFIKVEVCNDRNPLATVALANELLALWGRAPITETVLEGHLGAGA